MATESKNPAVYTTIEGDVLDEICWTHYGSVQSIGSVLDANPGLAAHGPVLAGGITVNLPDISINPGETPEISMINLWD